MLITSSPHTIRVSRQSLLSANDKGDNEMVRGLCTDLLAFTLKLRKTRENLSQETIDEGCATSYHVKWSSLLQNEIGRIAQHVSNRNGRKQGKDGVRTD